MGLNGGGYMYSGRNKDEREEKLNAWYLYSFFKWNQKIGMCKTTHVLHRW